ncbi:hypothetical protein B0H19DRAFT_1245680 [Mycena capillaripes]|nr:hypothetical protein B0H19DRAFT_1245680 [Mycena capillaripes]
MRLSAPFFSLVSLVAALPPAPRAVDVAISARTQGNVFVCTDVQFTGSCAVFHGASGQCINFPSAFNDDISSVGPTPARTASSSRNDGGCLGQQLGPVRSPGDSNLLNPATIAFNDQISSFQYLLPAQVLKAHFSSPLQLSQNHVLHPLKRAEVQAQRACIVYLPQGRRGPHRTGQAQGLGGKMIQVYRKKRVIHVDRVQCDKSNGATAPIGVHPGKVVITTI